MTSQDWYQLREHTPEKLSLARQVLEEVRAGSKVADAVRRHPLPDGSGYIGKHLLVAVYRQLTGSGEWAPDRRLLARIRMKPVRSLSGVAVVTVLTKPYPCPGKCIFCPTDVRMPKAYLPDEPGAMRGLQYDFDPFDQTASRLEALHAVGHPTDKIELLILGGTWSSYRKDYQEWFVRRCFDALNRRDSTTLAQAQRRNETALHRNVGLVIETRPDHVDPDELAWLRYLGVTKVQLGVQSLDDHILALNKRGHSVAETRQAVDLLRAAGFKIVQHWMPNLLGATPDSDRQDFLRLWDGFCPDELKIYPNQLLENAELYEYWQRGEFIPYTTEQLIDLIADIKPSIPRYCRVNRIIRDIPSTNVVAGNKRTSLRQDVHREMKRRGTRCQCVRCREIRKQKVAEGQLDVGRGGLPGRWGGGALSLVRHSRRPTGRIPAPLLAGAGFTADRPGGFSRRGHHPRGARLRPVLGIGGRAARDRPAQRHGHRADRTGRADRSPAGLSSPGSDRCGGHAALLRQPRLQTR